MKVIVVASPKGGVGKTFVAANLAHALSRGRPVGLWDFDVQNACRYHFGVHTDHGWACQPDDSSALPKAFTDTAYGVVLLPFGNVVLSRGQEAIDKMTKSSSFFEEVMRVFAERRVSVVICDTSYGNPASLDFLTSRASIVLHVLSADPGSAALFPWIEAGFYPVGGTLRRLLGQENGFVLNQVDWDLPLSERIARRLADRLGERLFGAICRHVCVMEALAEEKPLLAYAPQCPASLDVGEMAEAVERLVLGGARMESLASFPPLLKGLG